MKTEDSHISDQQLLLGVEGELSAADAALVRSHLDACWKCRARSQEIQNAIADYARAYEREFEGKLPRAAGPRALLKAQLAQQAASNAARTLHWFSLPGFVWALAGICCVLAVGYFLGRSQSPVYAAVVSSPNSRLTPGAALLATRGAVCAQGNIKNKAVPAALQKAVFEEYGLAGADPRAYEVDYLVTPALGGADDIHNLWPHSYSATVWNAQVKDALEDHLRDRVCEGSLDLSEAQREIATNWIVAYQKYFHTDQPLPEHNRGIGRSRR